MIYVKVNNTLYPAIVNGNYSDICWDNRESKAITVEGDFAMVNALFADDTVWSIIQENINQNGETEIAEFDNSDFSVRGDLTIHADGTCTVKMGKPTNTEILLELMYGGVK